MKFASDNAGTDVTLRIAILEIMLRLIPYLIVVVINI